MMLLFLLHCYLLSSVESMVTRDLSVCENPLFCYGNLLHSIQMSGLFSDSKTFVDRPAKYPPSQVLANFDLLTNQTDLTQLGKFVEENFHPFGYDIVQVENVNDWMERPEYTKRIKDPKLQEFAYFLNQKWKHLIKRFDSTKICSNCSSALPIPNSFIVPGGRFNEFYYWDTYWIIDGLLVSGMKQTARNMLENFLDMVDKIGFVPNGARIYYTNRSQPPLLTQMIYLYYQKTNDIEFVKRALSRLDREHRFWMESKLVLYSKPNDLSQYEFNVYDVESSSPRPESYKEDFLNGMESGGAQSYYSNVMTAAESGWDFSSRWFENAMDIKTIQIRDIIPVDLNSILFKNEVILSELHEKFGNKSKAQYYKEMVDERQIAINKMLWDSRLSRYGDLNRKTNRLHTTYKYPSDLAPLWSGVVPPVNKSIILGNYKSLLHDYVSGVPASDIDNGEQWDFPNVWAPYNEWLVDYLYKDELTRNDAFSIAERFVNTVYCGWKRSGVVYEKYHAKKRGERGFGGEYVVQEGFGWSNGVCMRFMDMFGDRLKAVDEQECSSSRRLNISYFVVFLSIIFSLSSSIM